MACSSTPPSRRIANLHGSHGRLARTGMAAAVLILGLASTQPAAAHSWSPHDCCHDLDCRPAGSIEIDKRGDFQVSVGKERIWAPRGFAIRPSEDEHAHICFRAEAEPPFVMPLCLFLPPGM